MGRLVHLGERLRLRLWIVPALGAILAALAALAIIAIEQRWDPTPSWVGIDPVSARYLLSAIASAMISFTALVFSVTMLVLQLASSQLSPRVTRTFLRDRFNQSVLGLFVATFVFALLLLVSIGPERVPQLGVVLAIMLVLVSVLAFVTYIDHMAHAVGASDVIGSIGRETRQVIDRLFPEEDGGEAGASAAMGAAESLPDAGARIATVHATGYVVAVDEERIGAIAAGQGLVVEVLVPTGTFVMDGDPLFALRRGHAKDALDELTSTVTIDRERTMSQDPAFGFRQLLDVAIRALSPGINDPSTANRVIDELGHLFRMLRDRPLPSPRWITRDGQVRALVPSLDWGDLLTGTVAELAHASREQPFVRAHLREVLDRLAADAAPDRAGPVWRAMQTITGMD